MAEVLTFYVNTSVRFFAEFLCNETKDVGYFSFPQDDEKQFTLNSGRANRDFTRVQLPAYLSITKINQGEISDAPIGIAYQHFAPAMAGIVFDLLPLAEERTRVTAKLAHYLASPYFERLIAKIAEAYPETRQPSQTAPTPTPSADTSQDVLMDPEKMQSFVNEIIEQSLSGASIEDLMKSVEQNSGIQNETQVPIELRARQADYNKEMILLTMQESLKRLKKHFAERGKKTPSDEPKQDKRDSRDNDLREIIARLYKSGKTDDEIASQVWVGKDRVKQIRHELGLKAKPRKKNST